MAVNFRPLIDRHLLLLVLTSEQKRVGKGLFRDINGGQSRLYLGSPKGRLFNRWEIGVREQLFIIFTGNR